jgi:signal transduction histidine kinase
MAPLAGRRTNVVRFAVGPIALIYSVAALVVARGPGALTSYAGESVVAAAGTTVAGLALIAAGLAISFRTPIRLSGLAIAAGFAWFAPIWIGWAGGPTLVRSLAMVVVGFELPLLWHLVLAYPNGRFEAKAAGALVAAVYLEAAVSAIGRALFRDPFFDPSCWDNCTDNAFLVRSLPELARGIQLTDLWCTAVAAAAAVVLCVWRFGSATGPAKRALWPITGGGVLLSFAAAAHSIAVLSAIEVPLDPRFLAIFLVACLGAVVIAVGLVWNGLRALAQRRSVGRIVANLGVASAPGSLQAALASAVGDAGLRIAYWLPDSERWIDAHGVTTAEPVASPGRMVTALVRDGRRIAVVDHATSVPELEPKFGAAVRLALDNERLQAEVLSQLVDLRDSRSRIVASGDTERRRLEHDLHDGAQQRLLALSYDLRLASASARTDGDEEIAAALAAATSEAQLALADLRELAHGIYPAILTEAGVASAIATLADGASLPVEIVDMAEERYPAPVETAIYVAVSEAIADAVARGASHLTVSLVRDVGRLVLDTEDDGLRRTSTMIHLVDRIGALGGKLELGPRRLRAEVPCA